MTKLFQSLTQRPARTRSLGAAGRDEAIEIALRSLAFIAADAALIEAFLGQSGLAPEDLRARADDPTLLAGVLDFVLQSDSTVCAFATGIGLPPERVLQARHALSGTQDDHQ